MEASVFPPSILSSWRLSTTIEAMKLTGPAWPSVTAIGARDPDTVVVSAIMVGRGSCRTTPALVPMNNEDFLCNRQVTRKQDTLCFLRIGSKSMSDKIEQLSHLHTMIIYAYNQSEYRMTEHWTQNPYRQTGRHTHHAHMNTRAHDLSSDSKTVTSLASTSLTGDVQSTVASLLVVVA